MINYSRDFWAGLLLCCLGAFIAWYSYVSYDMGSIKRMDAGYLPFVLALVLSVLGIITSILSQLSPSSDEDAVRSFEFRKVAPVALAVLVFSLSVAHLGLIVSTILLVCIASFADRRWSLKLSLILSVAFSLISSVVFVFLLQMQIPLFW
ncbi:MAG: tripartite tricarboxylate transporter TctB family protein [Pontibacterium sp.]